MSLTLRQTFDAIAPAYATHAGVDDMLTLATQRVDLGVLGDQASLAVSYLAAHMLELAQRAANGTVGVGPITGERAGQVSRNYAQPNWSGTPLQYYGSTQYGVEYLNIIRATAGTKWASTGLRAADYASAK